MPINSFLPFCPTDTGTNLVSDANYPTDTGRISGNTPGVARSALVNKALRQASYVTSQLAQAVSNYLNQDVPDNATPAQMLAQMNAYLTPFAPVATKYLAGSGTHLLTFMFFIASGNATAGAVYGNNGQTFTVTKTIAGGVILQTTGTGASTASGTLTKSSGTGDATLTFYAVKNAKVIRLRMAGGGGGGGGSGAAAGGAVAGGSGGSTTFGGGTAGGGAGGAVAGSSGGGAGGTVSLTTWTGLGITGGPGQGSVAMSLAGTNYMNGVMGGANPLGGAGAGYDVGIVAPSANTGAGGGAAGGSPGGGNFFSGCGGGAGGFVDALIFPANYTLTGFAFSVGGGGTAGTAGTSGYAGGAGAAGVIYVIEEF